MSSAAAPDRWPVRLWPGLAIVAAVAVLWVVPPIVAGRTVIHFVSWFGGPLLGAVVAAGWWAFGARVRGPMRWLVPTLVFVPVIALTATLFRKQEIFVVYALAAALVVWVGWLTISVPLPAAPRKAGLIASLVALWGLAAALQIDTTDADLIPTLRWRWTPTNEEIFLAERKAAPPPAATAPAVDAGPGDWPGFRGPKRDGLVTGVRLATDWKATPPVLVWKHRVGPGWGSFAVAGGRLFTQEQRGADEAVVCYDAGTGTEVWEYKTPARFAEAIAGPGPRATPTIHGGKVYAQGATGKLVRLDAATGTRDWEADVVAAGGSLAQWGYAASPLVTDGLVIVYAGGGNGKGTIAVTADTGAVAWLSGNAKHGYSSAHPAAFGGVPQVLMVSDYGLEAFAPADGKKLWEHKWPLNDINRATQPTVLSDTDVLIGTGVGGEQGTRRLRVARAGDGWDVAVVWSSRAMKPYFNDGVVVGGHLYGFDDRAFGCVELETGQGRWKETVYGHGQVLGLPDQRLLLVQAVDGSVALVEATPTDLTELARFPALAGKTWNHPVVAHGHLYVRNGQEAACYRLPVR